MEFWSQNSEIAFFKKALKSFASPDQLFYKLRSGYFAYARKGITTEGKTLQSRNSLIGQYTEKWCTDFLQPIANKLGLFSINSVICPELGLTNSTNADIAFCKKNEINQSAENISLIFEVKMSIVNNYSYNDKTKSIKFTGDYKTHKGIPSILRSDSMLKAIGKSINIRVSGYKSNTIPIIILGNSPISENYKDKVDFLKQAGIVQGFISLYPESTLSYIKGTPKKGFQTFNDYSLLQNFISDLIALNMNFFSSMLPKEKLGNLITVAAKEVSEIKKAEKFLQLLNSKK